MSRWLLKHNYVNRTKMNEVMRPPAEVYEEATLFMAANCPSLCGPHCDPRWILNMDQTLVYFSYHRSKMLAKHGIKTVHVRKSTSDTRQATCALTCMAAGNFLQPMLIYKGKLTGCIATREFKHHDPSSVYACQDAAWMDEVCMCVCACPLVIRGVTVKHALTSTSSLPNDIPSIPWSPVVLPLWTPWGAC